MKDLDKSKLEGVKKNFNEFGYVKVANVVNKRIIYDMQRTIYLRFLSYLPKIGRKNIKSFSSLNFHKELLKLKKNNPQKFGSFFDSVQCSLNVYKIFGNRKFLHLVSKLLNLNQEELSFSGVAIRMDAPKDRKSFLGWHQDRGYYHQNRSGKKGMNCWIPLTDITKDLGPLHICHKSSLDGFIKIKKKIYDKYSSKLDIQPNIIKKYKVVRPTLKMSDALFVNNNTIHKSGKNTTKYFRFVLLIRFHDLSDKYYLPFKTLSIYNKYEINKMKKKGLDLIEPGSNPRQSDLRM